MNRRAKGSGGKPWWNTQRNRFEIKVSLPTGKRRTVFGKTERDVERQREQLLGDIETGRTLTSPTLTVGQYLTQWLVSARLNVKPGTYRNYEGHVRMHLMPTLGKLSLKRLSPAQVRQHLIEHKLADGCSPRLVQMMQGVLRAALSDAVREDIIDRNVAKLVRVKVADNSRVGKALSVEQVAAVLAAAAQQRNGPLFLFLVTTGMRLGEALALQWSDIDLERRTFNLTKTLTAQPGEPWSLGTPKSGRSRFGVPLVEPSIKALRIQKSRQALERQVARDAWQDELDFVFTNAIGGPLHQRGVQDAWKRALASASLDNSWRVHDLRHTAVSYLIQSGVHPQIAMEIVGHSTLAMTQRYGHISPEMLEDARQKMNRFWEAALG